MGAIDKSEQGDDQQGQQGDSYVYHSDASLPVAWMSETPDDGGGNRDELQA